MNETISKGHQRLFAFQMRAAALGAAIRELTGKESGYRSELYELERRRSEFEEKPGFNLTTDRLHGQHKSGEEHYQEALAKFDLDIADRKTRLEILKAEAGKFRPEYESTSRLAQAMEAELQQQERAARTKRFESRLAGSTQKESIHG